MRPWHEPSDVPVSLLVHRDQEQDLRARPGHRRGASLHDILEGIGRGGLHIVGDALSPRTAEVAVMEGLEAVMAL